MKKMFLGLFLFLLLGGCGSTKTTPAWLIAGNQHLESFKHHFLTGLQPAAAERYFRRAVEEIKKAGDLDLLGKAWLTRMALQVAVLTDMEEGEYLHIEAARAFPANRQYYLFLKGDRAAVDRSLLPARYCAFVGAYRSGSLVETERRIAAMNDDPLSLLIASGIAVRHRMESEAILMAAADAASRQGWKRALLVWLERLGAFYDAAGKGAQAAAVRQRIDLMKK
ncbi:MAG: hypothetical protein AB1558_04220 [Thermodesulfobacteriota bacterium]